MKAGTIIRKTIICLILFAFGAVVGAASGLFFTADRVIREELYVRQADERLGTACGLRSGHVEELVRSQEQGLVEVLDDLRRPLFGAYADSLKIENMSKRRLRVFQEAKEYFEQFGWGSIQTNALGPRLVCEFLKQVPYTQERQEWDQWNTKYKGPRSLPAPELAGVEWLGQPQRPQDLSNHVVLLVFWGIRCGPCLEELPEVQKLQELYAERGLKIVAIHAQQQHDRAKAYLVEQKYTFPAGLLARGTLRDDYLVRGLPSNYLIDKEAHIALGPEHQLPSRQAIELLLAGQKLPAVTEPVQTSSAAQQRAAQ